MTSIEIFKKMLDWLCANKGIVYQVVAAKAALVQTLQQQIADLQRMQSKP